MRGEGVREGHSDAGWGRQKARRQCQRRREGGPRPGRHTGSRNARRVFLAPGAGHCVVPYPTSHLIWAHPEVAGGPWGVFSSPVRYVCVGPGCVWTEGPVFCFSVATVLKGVDPRPTRLSSECVLSQKPFRKRSFLWNVSPGSLGACLIKLHLS